MKKVRRCWFCGLVLAPGAETALFRVHPQERRVRAHVRCGTAFKYCRVCQVVITREEWIKLPIVGPMHYPAPEPPLMFRNHTCGSTLCIPLEIDTAARNGGNYEQQSA